MSGTLNYVDYSLSGLTTQLNNILLESDTWSDILTSSTGEIAINWWVSIANLILYYVERTAEEQYINTAQKESSVLNLVQLLNYTPYRNVSASSVNSGGAGFTLTLPSSHVVNVYIPAQTEILSIGGYYYQTTQSSVILAGQTSIEVAVIQGQWFSNTYTSNGNANQTYLINNIQVENSNLVIVVNGITWTGVGTFIGTGPTSQVYKLIPNIDGTLTIEFGNGVFGMIPTTGWSIIINYLQSDGVNGNIYGGGVSLSLVSTIYDANQNPVTGITVTNSAPIDGGANAETADQIRINAPHVFSTGQRAITKSDFKAILNNYPGIESSNVWGENDLNPPNFTNMNNLFISIVLQNWIVPTYSSMPQFLSTLGTFLYSYSIPCVTYNFIPAQVVQVMPYISIYALQGQSLSAIQSAVNTTFQNQFLLGETSQLGMNVRYADVITAVNQVPGIDYVYLTLAVYQPLTAAFTSSHDWGYTVPLLPIKAGTIKLYTNNGTLIAQDNGSGGWTSLVSGYTVVGTINYVTGSVEVNINPSQGSTPYITYQQNQNGDLVVGLNQILEYYNMNVQVLTYG